MITYPNQKVIHINKARYTQNFLQVGITEWQEAFQILTPTAFAIYLYLAGNADGFNLALSQKAIEDSLNIKKSAYHSALKQLRELGFIVSLQGNIEAFFTTPQVRKNELPNQEMETVRKYGLPNEEKVEVIRKNGNDTPQKRNEQSAKTDLEVRKIDREIDKINIIDNINKNDNIVAQENLEQEEENETASMIKRIETDWRTNYPEAYKELERLKLRANGANALYGIIKSVARKHNIEIA